MGLEEPVSFGLNLVHQVLIDPRPIRQGDHGGGVWCDNVAADLALDCIRDMASYIPLDKEPSSVNSGLLLHGIQCLLYLT
jgi:hypothetical protein